MDIEIKLPSLSDLCMYCYGSGKQKAMQMAMTYDAGSIRVNDTEVRCEHCKGTGYKK